jgi:hypothetical protein
VPVKRTRTLGLTVLRGPTIVLISPVNGSEGKSFSARRTALLTWPLNLLVRRLDGPGLHGRPAATTQATAGRSCASVSSGHLGSDSPNPSAGASGVSLSDKPTELTLPYLRPLNPRRDREPLPGPARAVISDPQPPSCQSPASSPLPLDHRSTPGPSTCSSKDS